jgi:hypothetical protein
LRASPARLFDAIGCISAKKDPFENTWACQLPSKDFTRPSIVSDAHLPANHFVWNLLSALCRLASDMIAMKVQLVESFS